MISYITEKASEEIIIDHKSNKVIDIVHDIPLKNAQLPFSVTSMGLFPEGRNFYARHEGFLNYALNFTLSGSGLIEYRNKKYIIKPGAVFFTNNNERMKLSTYTDHWEFCFFNCLGSSTVIFDMLLNSNDNLNVLYSLNINELFNNFIEVNSLLQQNEILSAIKASNIINQILTDMLTAYIQNQPDTILLRCPDWVVEAKEYIDNNFTEKLNINNLAKKHYVSEAYFIRKFKQYNEYTPKDYIIQKRLNEAKNLLLTTNDSINDIAYKVGFPTHSLFTLGFKKTFGCTPTDFRNIQESKF